MSLHTYDTRRRGAVISSRKAPEAAKAGPSMDALRSGAAAPTQELLGSRVDLPGAIQAKMESAFGADLSGVQLYESQAVADAGAEAITQGNKIGFAPGKLDFVSHQGQALLGHELSHVVSQARGEVSGSGFLNDHALESRADREGAMAAAGEQVYSGPVAGSLSGASATPAAGPMQAKKPPKETEGERYSKQVSALVDWQTRLLGASDEVSDAETPELLETAMRMTDTPEKMDRFTSELMAQRVAAAKGMNDTYERYGQGGDAFATTFAAYSPEADKFESAQQLVRTIGMETQDDRSEVVTQFGQKAEALSGEDMGALNRAMGISTRGISPSTLAQSVPDKRKSYFRAKYDNTVDQALYRRTNTARPDMSIFQEKKPWWQFWK